MNTRHNAQSKKPSVRSALGGIGIFISLLVGSNPANAEGSFTINNCSSAPVYTYYRIWSYNSNDSVTMIAYNDKQLFELDNVTLRCATNDGCKISVGLYYQKGDHAKVEARRYNGPYNGVYAMVDDGSGWITIRRPTDPLVAERCKNYEQYVQKGYFVATPPGQPNY